MFCALRRLLLSLRCRASAGGARRRRGRRPGGGACRTGPRRLAGRHCAAAVVRPGPTHRRAAALPPGLPLPSLLAPACIHRHMHIAWVCACAGAAVLRCWDVQRRPQGLAFVTGVCARRLPAAGRVRTDIPLAAVAVPRSAAPSMSPIRKSEFNMLRTNGRSAGGARWMRTTRGTRWQCRRARWSTAAPPGRGLPPRWRPPSPPPPASPPAPAPRCEPCPCPLQRCKPPTLFTHCLFRQLLQGISQEHVPGTSGASRLDDCSTILERFHLLTLQVQGGLLRALNLVQGAVCAPSFSQHSFGFI